MKPSTVGPGMHFALPLGPSRSHGSANLPGRPTACVQRRQCHNDQRVSHSLCPSGLAHDDPVLQNRNIPNYALNAQHPRSGRARRLVLLAVRPRPRRGEGGNMPLPLGAAHPRSDRRLSSFTLLWCVSPCMPSARFHL